MSLVHLKHGVISEEDIPVVIVDNYVVRMRATYIVLGILLVLLSIYYCMIMRDNLRLKTVRQDFLADGLRLPLDYVDVPCKYIEVYFNSSYRCNLSFSGTLRSLNGITYLTKLSPTIQGNVYKFELPPRVIVVELYIHLEKDNWHLSHGGFLQVIARDINGTAIFNQNYNIEGSDVSENFIGGLWRQTLPISNSTITVKIGK